MRLKLRSHCGVIIRTSCDTAFGRTHGSLLSSLRAELERKIEAARKSLAGLDREFECSMGYDYATLSLEELWRVDDFARDMLAEMRDAILGREGYDTWPHKDRDRIIEQFRAVAEAYESLAHTVRVLREREHAEVQQMRANIPVRDGEDRASPHK